MLKNEQGSAEIELHEDMRRLADEVRARREKPEVREKSEEEVLKDAIRAFPDLKKNTEAGKAEMADHALSDNGKQVENNPLPEYAKSASPETKLEIEYLLDIALEHGLSKATEEASKSPYFVEDAFHDALAGKLYPELKRRGLI